MSGNAAERVEDVIESAKQAGFEVIETDPHTLLLDLDSPQALALYEAMLAKFGEQFCLVEKQRWRSKSGKGWHVVVRSCVFLDPYERVAMQASLGSDPVRELLAVKYIAEDIQPFSFLFKPKPEAV